MNYTELRDTAKLYSDRYDSEIDDNVDIFFSLVEARINRLLKTREQSFRSTTPTIEGAEYYPLPSDFRGMRNIQLNSDPNSEVHDVKTFNLMNPTQMDGIRQGVYEGKIYYSVIANQIQIWPTQPAGKEIEIVYYRKVPPLTATNTTNWVSDEHPDMYISGLCGEISLFAKDYDAADGWLNRMKTAVLELDVSDEEEIWSGAPMVSRSG